MPKAPARIPVPPLTEAMYANGKRSEKNLRSFDVIQVHYDRAHDMLDLTLRSGIGIRIPRSQIREIAEAQPKDLAKVEIQPGGDGLSFRKLDIDISVPGLLADELGALFSRAMGRRTRGRTTPKKAAASRENGRKGGRPKKPSAAA
jgi:hypothetical protein